ncbi:transcription factor bHLH87-like [Andrographis paniculata]|uniref:transcription factor bHLH87-like n=1 Tax=Andrographis paniculata TaxID=175694 RepID=UPI0021E84288|nr:transcription factor bHLH87-like [Andrographis paniculata]
MESLVWDRHGEEDEETLKNPAYPDSNSDISVFPPWNLRSGVVLTSWGQEIHPNNALILDPGISNCFSPPLIDDGISRFFSDSKSPWNFLEPVPVPVPVPVPSMSSLSGNPKNTLETARTPSHTPGNQDFQGPKNYTATGCHPGIHPIPKKPRLDNHIIPSPNVDFQSNPETQTNSQSKEMIYRAAVFRPVNFTIGSEEKPRRKNVRISNDPQTVAARQRRERISERIRVLQRLVPGGSKMDMASMLDEAANYLKFLRAQAEALEDISHKMNDQTVTDLPGNVNLSFSPFGTFAIQNQSPVNMS